MPFVTDPHSVILVLEFKQGNDTAGMNCAASGRQPSAGAGIGSEDPLTSEDEFVAALPDISKNPFLAFRRGRETAAAPAVNVRFFLARAQLRIRHEVHSRRTMADCRNLLYLLGIRVAVSSVLPDRRMPPSERSALTHQGVAMGEEALNYHTDAAPSRLLSNGTTTRPLEAELDRCLHDLFTVENKLG